MIVALLFFCVNIFLKTSAVTMKSHSSFLYLCVNNNWLNN